MAGGADAHDRFSRRYMGAEQVHHGFRGGAAAGADDHEIGLPEGFDILEVSIAILRRSLHV